MICASVWQRSRSISQPSNGRPASGRSTLPGSRADECRARMMTPVFISSSQAGCGPVLAAEIRQASISRALGRLRTRVHVYPVAFGRAFRGVR
jgi:hypothetical protein